MKSYDLLKAKLNEWVAVGSDIREMIFYSNSLTGTTTKENETQISFKVVLAMFLGNVKGPFYELIVAKMRGKFENLGCVVTLYFLHNYLAL